MELWIRSQDKRHLLLVKNISLAEYEVEGVWTLETDLDNGIDLELGAYNTKERALEVLDEIHKCIVDKEVLYSCNNILTLADNKSLNEVKQILDRAEKIAVYEMPKE